MMVGGELTGIAVRDPSLLDKLLRRKAQQVGDLLDAFKFLGRVKLHGERLGGVRYGRWVRKGRCSRLDILVRLLKKMLSVCCPGNVAGKEWVRQLANRGVLKPATETDQRFSQRQRRR